MNIKQLTDLELKHFPIIASNPMAWHNLCAMYRGERLDRLKRVIK